MRQNKILWVIIFNLSIVIAEIFYGIVANSFALLADALHNTGDVLALIVTYFALRLATQKASFKYTFGFIKAEMLAAFVNSLFLMLVMAYIIYEATIRLFNPEITDSIYMINIGLLAFVANSISSYVLYKMNLASSYGHTHDANIYSAYLHMLSDALISLGVVLGGIFIYYLAIYSIDSWLAIGFSIYIIKHNSPLLKRSFLSLLDANTMQIDQVTLDEIIKNQPHILEYHNLHIYQPSSKHKFISFHLVLNDKNMQLKVANKITQKIRADLIKYGFNHVLIQTDLKLTSTESLYGDLRA